MNWNFTVGHFNVRLPVSDQDGDALFELLSEQQRVDHIPRLAMTVSAQALDELRRMAMRFETREAAFWLIEGTYDQQLVGRIGIQKINWMQLSAQLQWEVKADVDEASWQAIINAVCDFCFDQLGLHRLEVHVRKGWSAPELHLEALPLSYEGYLPAHIEYHDETLDLDVYSYLASDRPTALTSH